ncbi:MAG: hypothetical protein ACRYG7_54670 [Janthinobacterium lividum]
MATLFPAPSPAEIALLKNIPFLQHPNQQSTLAAYEAGNIGMETTVYDLLDEVRARHPAIEAQLAIGAEERAIRAREEEEMAANEKATEPTIIEFVWDGKPLGAKDEQIPLATNPV